MSAASLLATGSSLVAFGAEVADLPTASVDRLSRVLLGHPDAPVDHRPRRSALNADGDPLQLLVSIGAERRSVRIIADPAADELDRLRRRERATRTVLQAAHASGVPTEPFSRLLAATLPPEPDPSGPDVGECWVASEVTGAGVAVYTNSAWGRGTESSVALRAWLRAEAGGPSEVAALLDATAGDLVQAASAGIEVDIRGVVRSKLYFRLRRAVPLARLPVPLLGDPVVARFLEVVLARREVPITGVVFSAGTERGSGAVVDAKVDVCCCPRCLDDRAGWWDVTRADVAALAGLDLTSLGSLEQRGVEPAFVGLGVRPSGDVRVNLYLKAT